MPRSATRPFRPLTRFPAFPVLAAALALALFLPLAAPADPASDDPAQVAAPAREAFTRGLAALRDGHTLPAVLALLEAWKADSGNPILMSRLGRLIVDFGETRLAEGREMLARLMVLRKDAATEEERIAYARSLFLTEPFKLDEAETLLRSILKASPQNAAALTALGDLELFRNRHQAALDWFKQARTLAPADKRALFGIAYALIGLKKDQEALAALHDAQVAAPGDPWAHVRMGRGLLLLNQPLTASRHFKLALEADPDYLPAHLAYIAQLLPNVGDMTAWRHLQAAQRLDPENPQVYYWLGVFQEMRGHVDQAVENYEIAEAYGPQAVEVKLRLARIFAGIGHSFPGNVFSNEDFMAQKEYQLFYDGERALRLLREVQALAPDHPETPFITTTIEKLETSLARLQE
ncbi:MAG: tetratricopeptide repeat protein [Candidatus Riflebacteria bacterium]|nr:tetratricopeptide repeat protein [Candidatus Riflebacteria bacterium]